MGELTHVGPPAMRMPSDVAVAPDGAVYVADGVNDRVLVFGPGGHVIAEINTAGDRPLDRPLAVERDARGRLWIADTGNARIVALDPAGQLAVELRPPAAARPLDITGIAVDLERDRVWFTDNDADQVGYCLVGSGATTRFGASGESLGQFRYPYAIATAPGGDVFVGEALNGRVQVLTARGQPAGALGRYGVALGELYRPKGIAIAADGHVWVSDSRIGVVQVFRPTGECLDVLRGADGRPLRFATPSGLALDAHGNLYVAELGADRVVRVAISRDPEAPPAGVTAAATPLRQPRLCTSCHVEWLAPLVDGQPTGIMPVPDNPPDHPAVSRSENCLACHDGAIVDSRRRVWIDHGHRRGLTPGAATPVPAHLPLPDGAIACRTCHSAHTRGGAGETIANAVFLRVDQEPVELCVACHSGQTDPARGNHALAPADAPLATALTAAHGRLATDDTISCLTCHAAHGGAEQLLLNVPGTASALCVSCHADVATGAHGAAHPVDVALDDARADLVRQAGGRVGAGGLLVCSSCHAMHDAAHSDALLRQSPVESAACRACHVEQARVVASIHNLGFSHPDATNDAGVSVSTAGPCSACHMAHRPARSGPQQLANDPAAQCTTCHAAAQPDGSGQPLAHQRTLTDINHPGAVCTACHNPHSDVHGSFLAQSPATLCQSCHSGYATVGSGPHGQAAGSDAWPAAAREAASDCLACHVPHGNATDGLWRAGLGTGGAPADNACLACHADAAWSGGGQLAAWHPRSGTVDGDVHNLPLTAEGMLGCRTCHDPHAGGAAAALLRTGGHADVGAALCGQCHASAHTLTGTAHGASDLAAAGFEASACAPCHRMHADRDDLAIGGPLWPAALTTSGERSPESTADRLCSACHGPGGAAPTPEVATHPELAMQATRGTSRTLPLFDEAGAVSDGGRITCRTCHLPHGRAVDAPLPAGVTRDAQRPLLRPFAAPNLCTDCHGFEGLRRFLNFHDPARRAAPARAPAAPGLWSPRNR